MHTSPPCTFASKGQRINVGLGRDLKATFTNVLLLLDFCRSLHVQWRSKAFRREVRVTASHEQASYASTSLALASLPHSEHRGIGPGFPWAVAEGTRRVCVNAAAVGLRDRTTGSLVHKCWTFETDDDLLWRVLRSYRQTPPDAETMPVWRCYGKPGAGAKASEKYPFFLGCLLGASVALS